MSIPNINIAVPPFANRGPVNAPPAHVQSSWGDAPPLHVAAVYTNPLRWRSRRLLFEEFRAHMEASAGVVLHVAELAYGDRPFDVTSAPASDNQDRLERSHPNVVTIWAPSRAEPLRALASAISSSVKRNTSGLFERVSK